MGFVVIVGADETLDVRRSGARHIRAIIHVQLPDNHIRINAIFFYEVWSNIKRKHNYRRVHLPKLVPLALNGPRRPILDHSLVYIPLRG